MLVLLLPAPTPNSSTHPGQLLFILARELLGCILQLFQLLQGGGVVEQANHIMAYAILIHGAWHTFHQLQKHGYKHIQHIHWGMM